MHGHRMFKLAVGLAALGLGQTALRAQDSKGGTIEADGTVVVPSFKLPPSIYTSEEAKKALPRTPADPEAGMFRALASGRVGEARKMMPQLMGARLKRLTEMYGVTTRATEIAGVPAVYATPVKAIPTANRKKIMLNLPGGGFVMGVAGGTGMVESIPLAALAQVEIVSITYRQAPDAMFPAASEDVVKVYRELLKTHKAQDIAVFGCSAGGLLTAEAMAAFQKEKLPLPAAVGIFCASADARWGGDSRAFGRPFQALPSNDAPRRYFAEGDLTDPLASPVLDTAVLKRFPPTLLITATRAMEMSAAVNTHRELVKAGVDADLHVWDGLGHAFFYDIGLPESKEAFAVMTTFFRKHLRLK
ncbi:alpha/beta hydrolase [Sphingomonas sp. SUN039]|uniref:alpha/beta hydrolase n=1 Tax=Sphingomonas sp. SUN039 TaxID=2937787 RepID=UPI0021647BD5|nr:alpha/beta hydrolase [Sphingomonas sp. SUN039]UVO54248.1 alpha/beta hydrolase [Sphingomonas sp. SUN039]